jgi:DNA-binding response OmpR family regulator
MITKPILLVEDEENDVFFFQRAVMKAGILNPVQVARDGQEAIDYLRGVGKFAQRAEFPLPSLVLLDLKLPFVMGLDVLKWIRQQLGLAPIVIILSSSQEEADIAAAYRLGANGYLVKPAEVSRLGDMVRAINDFWLTQNTPPPTSSQVGELTEFAADLRTQGVGGQRCSPASNARTQVHSPNPRTDL